MNYTFLIFLIVASCVPKSFGPGIETLSTKTPVSATRNRPHLFPNGIYSHRITITDSKGEKREFRGFLRLREHALDAIGLSKLDTTFFTLHEDFSSKKLTYHFYYPLPRKFKKGFVVVYSSMKKIFLIPLRKKVGEGSAIVHFNAAGLPSRYVDAKEEMVVSIGRYDQNLIPMTLAIEYKNVSVKIDLDEYQLGNSSHEE